MKTINKKQLASQAKNYLSPLVFLLLAGLFIYQAFFVYTHLQEKEIDQTALIAREEKINESGYNSVIQKNNLKKEFPLDLLVSVESPF